MERRIIDGKYELQRLLGQGGMGAVYEAIDVASSRRVALKLLLADSLAKEPDVIARFKREAHASAAIDSAHVVRVLDSGVDPSTNDGFMVMELLAGEDVHELVQRLGPLDPDLVLRLVSQACVGLERAHDAGVIHRDIKPANMFLVRGDGGERTLKLLDFGIAKVRRDALSASDGAHGLTRSGTILGSPLYMSPEQAVGSKTLDYRSDVFSLGVMMYELLSGRTPHAQCETIGELLVAICVRDARPVQDLAPWVPRAVAAIVHKALERAPASRYQTAAEMRAAIASLRPDARIDEGMVVPMPETTRAVFAETAPIATPLDRTDVVAAPPPWQLPIDRIEKQMTLRSPVSAVWSAITDAREFGRWFGVDLDGPFVEGASTTGRTRPTLFDPEIAKLQEPFAGTPFEVKVERVEPTRHFSFRWHPFALDPDLDASSEPTTLVVFELGAVDGGTRVTITESGFERLPPRRRVAAFTSNEGGWRMQAKLLEKYLARANDPG